VDREFYESVTRSIRFSAYKAVANGYGVQSATQISRQSRVLLGHIQDDAVENIWTNFARGLHLDNLAKMEPEEVQLGVNLWRPLLNIQKSAIYEAAAALRVPHLKNTTPSWCNRGKFREHFYAQTHAQYGPEVDAKLLEVAAALKTQAALIDRLLYQRIYESWDPATKSLNVEPALRADLDAEAWLRIFEHVCHKYLQVCRPSIHAMRELLRRLQTYNKKYMQMNVGKGLSITLRGVQLQFALI
jgi:tRNA(Ile)-lysidine synthase TilS/MesJ